MKYVEWLKGVFVNGKLNREGVKEVTEDTAQRFVCLAVFRVTHTILPVRFSGGVRLSCVSFCATAGCPVVTNGYCPLCSFCLR